MIDETIRQFMSRDVLSGDPDTSLVEAVARMSRSPQSAFIVCEDDQPVGVMTEKDAVDLLARVLAGEAFVDLRVSDCMTSPAYTLHEASVMGDVIRIMAEGGFRHVPVVDDKHALIGIVDSSELQSALNAALEKRGRNLEVAVMARTAELQAANARLEALSRHDALTGLANRRAMDEKLDELSETRTRYGNPYSVALIDIDFFKPYNDLLGHPAGDRALCEVARVLEDTVRGIDSVFRYGGEEFLVALPETDLASAEIAADRVRAAIEAKGLPHPDSDVAECITVSVGVATSSSISGEAAEGWHAVLDAADAALYSAKSAGRNRISASRPPA